MPPIDEVYIQGPTEPLIICFRIITRRSWDELQSFHKALPGSRIEHVKKGTGLFVLLVYSGGLERSA